MSGFSFQYFCNGVVILCQSFWWVFFHLFYQNRVTLPGQMYPFVEDGCSLGDSGRGLKSGGKPTTDLWVFLLPPAVSTRWDLGPRAGSCHSVCIGWPPDAGGTLESLCKAVKEDGGRKLDWPQPLGVDPRPWGLSTWKKPPRSVVKAVHLHSCSVEIWACRRSNGFCGRGAYWFFSRQLSPLLLCFPSFWELGKLVRQSWTTDSSWSAAWRENDRRERWRRVDLKLQKKYNP